MASRAALMALLVAMSCAAAASAETFNVGEGSGWTTGTNYDTWASGKTFAVGDKLVFTYASGTHTVTEVSKSDYDACSSSNAISNDSNGPTTVTLTSPGPHYYICTITGHCSAGMKLAVTVGSGSGSGSPATPATPGTPSTPTASTPTGASARLQAGPALAVAAGVLVKLALF